jgi:hypothetical protein
MKQALPDLSALCVCALVATKATATLFAYTGDFATFTVTTPGAYDIIAYGAQGGGNVACANDGANAPK